MAEKKREKGARLLDSGRGPILSQAERHNFFLLSRTQSESGEKATD